MDTASPSGLRPAWIDGMLFDKPVPIIRRALITVLALIGPALLLGAVAPNVTEPTKAPAQASLTGQLLVAPTEMLHGSITR
jgi:hypothetical protein